MTDSGKGRKLTINDIAKDLGLSTTTISRAISGKGRIGAATRKRVQEYIDQNHYSPNAVAKGLAQSKTYNLGVVLPSDSNITETPFFQNCLMGVCEVAASLDYDVVVTTVTEDDISLLKRLIKNHKVDGVILTRTLINDLPAAFMQETGLPFVVIGSSKDDNIYQIDHDHKAACRELTSLLLLSGNKKMALIAGNQNYRVNEARYEGFIEAHSQQGQMIDSRLLFMEANSKIFIDRAVEHIMENEVDCIVCSDDQICSKVLAKLEALKCHVPDDIKVASFYNSSYLENHIPSITSIHINASALGIAAGEVLIALINGEKVQEKLLIKHNIVLKESTM